MPSHGVSEYEGEPVSGGNKAGKGIVVEGNVNSEITRPDVPEAFQINNNGAVEEDLAVDTVFKEMLKRVSEAVAAQGSGVSIYDKEDGKAPLAYAEGESGTKLEEMAHEIYPEFSKVGALQAYLLRTSACYVEMKTTRFDRSTGDSTPSKEKYIATTNIDIAKEWVGEGVLKNSHYVKLEDIDDVYEDEELPILKLENDKEGKRKIVSPRKPFIPHKKISVVPLYLYEGIVNYLYTEAQDKYVRVKYRRSSGEAREMDITFNSDLIRKVYSEEVTEEAVKSIYSGDFFNEKNINRGFIKVASIGESKFDGITRSLNFSSIYDIELDVVPDTTYVDIDINLAIPQFLGEINKLFDNDGVQDVLKISSYLEEDGIAERSIGTDPDAVSGWVRRKKIIEGTSFEKKLSLFMMMNLRLFPSYEMGTDKKASQFSESESFGLL